MNDTTIKNTSSISLVTEFSDEDTRTINIDNPKSDITTAMLASVQSAMQGVLIGDKTGATFTRIKTATRKNTTTTEIVFTE